MVVIALLCRSSVGQKREEEQTVQRQECTRGAGMEELQSGSVCCTVSARLKKASRRVQVEHLLRGRMDRAAD